MKILISLIITLLFAVPSYGFEYEGISYTILDSDKKICQTSEPDRYFQGNKPVGKCIIPKDVYDKEKDPYTGEDISVKYTVVAIGKESFAHAYDLTSVELPNSVTDIEYNAFGMCTSLTSVYIPESVRKIDYSAFGGCYALESLVIPKSVSFIGEAAFVGCGSLKSVSLPESGYYIGNSAFNQSM